MTCHRFTTELEAEMESRARSRVLDGSSYIPMDSVAGARLAVAEGRLFAITVEGRELVPRWAIAGGAPLPALAAVLCVLHPHRDGWGVAYWFASINSMLDNRPPLDVLRTDPAAVLLAAQAEINDQLCPHG